MDEQRRRYQAHTSPCSLPGPETFHAVGPSCNPRRKADTTDTTTNTRQSNCFFLIIKAAFVGSSRVFAPSVCPGSRLRVVRLPDPSSEIFSFDRFFTCCGFNVVFSGPQLLLRYFRLQLQVTNQARLCQYHHMKHLAPRKVQLRTLSRAPPKRVLR